MGEEYGIYPGESKILRIRDDNADINIFFGLFILHYLLTSKAIPISKEWISEKDIPGGVGFFSRSTRNTNLFDRKTIRR